MVLGKDGKVISGFSGRVACSNPSDGTVAWKYPCEGEAKTCRVGDDGTTFGSVGCRAFALSEAGTEKWSYDLGSKADEPTLAGDTVYVGSTGGRLVSLSKLSQGKIYAFMPPASTP